MTAPEPLFLPPRAKVSTCDFEHGAFVALTSDATDLLRALESRLRHRGLSPAQIDEEVVAARDAIRRLLASAGAYSRRGR